MSTQSVSLPLDQPRVVVIKQNDKKFTYRFRRLTAGDWSKYYRGIVAETEVVKEGQRRVFDARTALQVLVEDTLQSVEGYTGPGGVSVDQLDNWKMKLPTQHKLAAAGVLAEADAEPRDPSVISDLNEVSISSLWSAADNGSMVRCHGLIHRFTHPSIEQLRRLNSQSSRSVVVGGSRTGKTIWPGRQEILVKFYDELIVSVDGYTFGGQPLDGQLESIKNQMDTHHKVVAAQALFSEGEEAEAATAGAE